MHRLSVLWFVLLCILSIPASSQYYLDFDKLSLEDGFASNKANVIIQDRKGFIWIGTWNGLNRYDGYNCEIFQPNYHDTTVISNREISALMEDHNGNIWIGTTSGLNCLNPITREIKRYKFQNRIISLLEDKENHIWVGTWNDGLFKMDSANGVLEHYFFTDIVSDIHEDTRGNFWVATYNGLINLDRSTGSFVRYLPDAGSDNSISHSKVTQVVESKKGNLWLSTWGGGLNKLIPDPDRTKMRFLHYVASGSKGSLSSNVVYRLFYDQFDNLWAGTWDAGLNLLDASQQDLPPEKAHFYTYEHDLSDPYSLSGNNISTIYVDRSGILWVGSSKIERTNIIKSGASRYKTIRFENGILTKNWVRSFEVVKDNVLVGTSDEIKVFQFQNEELVLDKNVPNINYNVGSHSFFSNSILAMLNTEKGLWLGTEDAGLLFYPGNTFFQSNNRSPKYLNTVTNPSLPGNKVNNIVASKFLEETIWIGTMQNGFCKLYYVNGIPKIKTYSSGYSNKLISDINIRTIAEDSHGKVWIGTQNGLNSYNPELDKFEQFFYSQDDTTSLNDNVINIVFEDSRGDLWIGTNLGLNKKEERIAPDGSKQVFFKSYPNIKGIDKEIVLNILEDDNDNLWIGLYKGFVKFSIDQEMVDKEYFTKEYQHVIVERNVAARTQDGIFFFGGGNGFMFFHPDSILRNSKPSNVCLTGLVINNENIENNSHYTRGKAIPYLDKLELTNKDKIITFAFSAMNYKDPKRNMYAYFLEGFDEKWNQVGTRNTATYTNLKPGEYVFKVKASDSDGIWNDDYTSITVKIAAPWWKTVFAYIIYGIIFIGLLYFFNQYTLIEAREKGRITFESMQYEREHELNELKSLFFTNITHEFRTPLTLILGPAGELLKSKELQKNSLRQAELIQRNAQRLLRLVNQLMEFRKVEKGKMELFMEQTDIALILNDIYDSFNSMAESKNIDFVLSLQKKELPAYVDIEKFERALFNIVSNAFKYSEEGDKISIWAGTRTESEDLHYLTIEIEDTGIGIAKEHREKVFERFFQANQKHSQSTGGIGLFLSKTFIELHNGAIELESELGKGSCFRIKLPLNQKHELKAQIQYDTKPDGLKAQVLVQSNEPEGETVMVKNNSSLNSKSKVLIVEDDGELNGFIVNGLSADFNVTGCYNGKEGLELARKINPDIIITDIMMPEMNGIELCKTLRKDLSTSHIPVVFLTAKTRHEDEVLGLKIGAVDYIHKPFNLVSLKLKIGNLLENRRSIHGKMRADKIMEPEQVELSDLDESFLKEAVEAVNSNLDDPAFDVEKFSDVLGISTNQVYRKIKALTGQTAKEFIRNQRLKTAAQLFLQKKRSISEVIYMVGFSSPSYFTRCFREYYGCTPREYIDKNGVVNEE